MPHLDESKSSQQYKIPTDCCVETSQRGNGRSDVFRKDEDFAAFVNLMREAHEKVPMRLTGFCLMTNHFHVLFWPLSDGAALRGTKSAAGEDG